MRGPLGNTPDLVFAGARRQARQSCPLPTEPDSSDADLKSSRARTNGFPQAASLQWTRQRSRARLPPCPGPADFLVLRGRRRSTDPKCRPNLSGDIAVFFRSSDAKKELCPLPTEPDSSDADLKRARTNGFPQAGSLQWTRQRSRARLPPCPGPADFLWRGPSFFVGGGVEASRYPGNPTAKSLRATPAQATMLDTRPNGKRILPSPHSEAGTPSVLQTPRPSTVQAAPQKR